MVFVEPVMSFNLSKAPFKKNHVLDGARRGLDRVQYRLLILRLGIQMSSLSTSFLIAGVRMVAISPPRFDSVSLRMFSLPGRVLPAASALPPNSAATRRG